MNDSQQPDDYLTSAKRWIDNPDAWNEQPDTAWLPVIAMALVAITDRLDTIAADLAHK